MQGRAVELSPVVLAQYADAHRQDEYHKLASAVAQCVYCLTLPPDDAYGWIRAVVWKARQLNLIPAHDDASQS